MTQRRVNPFVKSYGLHDFANERDACGVGFVANVNGVKSHDIVEQGVEVLRRLLHRGAVGGDPNTGDGAGMLMQTPDAFLRREMDAAAVPLPPVGDYGVGFLFLPRDGALADRCVERVEKSLADENLPLLGWRVVPTRPKSLGEMAQASCPDIRQVFIGKPKNAVDSDQFERRLYAARRVIEKAVAEIAPSPDDFYVVSMSSRTIVYKGLLMATQIPEFYPDLRDETFTSALAIVHQRYSTNTFPTWPLAQPFRYLAHNGEINTLRGNFNQMRAREHAFDSPLFGDDVKKLIPIIATGQSDSACLDNALELFSQAGRSLPHVMMMLIPDAWGEKYHLGADLTGFFDYHAGLMEPWDGPAAIAFSDGRAVGARLDRNGLRPARFTITDDGMIVLASEAGVLDIPAKKIKTKGCLRPGEMIYADLERERILFDGEIKIHTARRQPYRRWVQENRISLHGFFDSVMPPAVDETNLLTRQRLFGYTREDVDVILQPMAATGHEPTGSMGDDAALAVLSDKPQLLYRYFKQLFAQVTNPSIDPIREELVMSLMTFIGNQPNVLGESPLHAHLLKMKHPILTNEDLERLRNSQLPSFQSETIPIGFFSGGRGKALKPALRKLAEEVEFAVKNGKTVIVLSDKNLIEGQTPIPALLAVSAVNQRLIRQGLRTRAGVVVETGEAREIMHFALLLGYGATAINPYLAVETIVHLTRAGRLGPDVSVTKAMENFINAICKGLLKIMSKMGISTLRSYRGAQVFEAIGLDQTLIDDYFTGTSSRIGGIRLDDVAAEADARRRRAFAADQAAPLLLETGGAYKYRVDGEKHLWSPEAIATFQQAVRTNDRGLYRQYETLVNDQQKRLCTLRGLFKFKLGQPVPVEEVEPAVEIVKRFVTGAMSFGSISREAHETIAIAMNRLGGMSNSGEGGEDPARFKRKPNGDSLCSAIKQVASGRFGVTIEYLANARDIQIKIAQGAKPGEGGQLPGHKVDRTIARVRHSTPGVTLISPPPHHDIYSIEDLSQLIYDLKNANPDARVSVKLVSEVGVGTVAAGVAKGHADMILISGHDGGTGASPLTSIKHAGAPWELGLAETQQTLVLNQLRDRVRVQADGQMKTARDVVVAACLGAEEFGFATTILVAIGCVMMRKCHANTCPVGVATQDPELRKRFRGEPEHVTNFLTMLAEEVRAILAELGFRSIDEVVGRGDLLDVNPAIDFWKSKNLDFSKLFEVPDDPSLPMRCSRAQDHGLENAYDQRLLAVAKPAIKLGKPVEGEFDVANVHRSVGTMLSGAIAKKHGGAGLPEGTIRFTFNGCAGQSFGAFLAGGVTFTLVGESNDYLGKGLSGGKIIVKPPPEATFDPAENIIVGNVLLYGATSGEIYINGRAGERFAIRNSGAKAVVEGVGDHCCEYMTGGRVVVLGDTGVNFGAGMSGGLAYVYDETNLLDVHCNLSMVDLEAVTLEKDAAELREFIERHVAHTGSAKARSILDDWENALPMFVKVFPMEYRKALGLMSKEDEAVEREAYAD